ncbi:MAG: response regulator transcription factor [Prevotella sp.]|jgi:DNA-binding response OmpR family regulator|nr:response regulator transcription factor [Prevotella sp.]
MAQKILIIDDESDIRDILQYNLENEGYATDSAKSAEDALEKIEKENFALLLLDVMMGETSGFKMADILRKQGNQTPIIFLTAKNTENDMLTGFSIGADDYIRKPFSIKEVIARVKSVLKRSETEKQKQEIALGSLIISLDAKTASIDGSRIGLTKTEFNILSLLAQHRGRIFSRSEILDYAWEEGGVVLDRTVDVHIGRLRKKLALYGKCIMNRSGYGYCFEEP